LEQTTRAKAFLAAGHRKKLMELVRTENLQLSFGAIVVADNINFSLHEGERLAVIGANGAGKTTFINIVTGYCAREAGAYFLLEPMSPRCRPATSCIWA
jgi:ABC-type branched-subunit amino acid transport system ATPase component